MHLRSPASTWDPQLGLGGCTSTASERGYSTPLGPPLSLQPSTPPPLGHPQTGGCGTFLRASLHDLMCPGTPTAGRGARGAGLPLQGSLGNWVWQFWAPCPQDQCPFSWKASVHHGPWVAYQGTRQNGGAPGDSPWCIVLYLLGSRGAWCLKQTPKAPIMHVLPEGPPFQRSLIQQIWHLAYLEA